ncbi:hypothetical protein K502DRAFT_353865 [Neoconidiobolus thromboides FSU 785]|nr:hypothetical protein K502DRAFT_353865 [Neoconidiobolus thromboides FSU 785]
MFTNFKLLLVLFFVFFVTSDICRRCNKKGAVGRTCIADYECGNACSNFPRSPKWGINGDCDWVLFFVFFVTSDICRRCNKKGAVGRTCVADHECGNACSNFPRSPKWGINGDCDWGSCCCGADC